VKIRKSLLITFSSTYAKLAIQFIASLFIARLLTPEEFGIFSISMLLVLIADTLRNFGVAGYIVQERELTQARLDSASGLNYITSWFVGGLVALLAEPAAGFFDADGVGDVMRLLSLNFLMMPVGAATMAYMRRKLMFDRIAIVRISQTLISTASSVTLAFIGFSYMSLAWGYLLGTVVSIALIWRLKPKGLRIRPSLRETRPVLRFGMLSTINALTKEGGRRAPDLVLGRLISVEAVAFFARADGLIELFRRLVVNTTAFVAMPHFAAQIRAKENPVRTYLLAMAHITAIGWPFYGVIAIVAPQLIPILYGGQWEDSIPVAQLLCIGEFLLAPFYLQDHMLVAKGRIGLTTIITLLTTSVRLLVALLLAPAGLNVVVAGYAVASLATAGAGYMVNRRVIGVSFREFWGAVMPSALVALATLLVAAMVAGAAHAWALSDILVLLMVLFASGAGWLGGLFLARHPLRLELGRLLSLLREKAGR
jgi:O-antigen/teichoic acid export membrane protein